MQDPALRELVGLTREYKTTIVVVTLVMAALGGAVGFSAPRTYVGRAVVEPAEIAPDGAVENLEVSASRVETFIESQVVTEAIDEGTKVKVVVLRDQPPSSMPVNLLALEATAPSIEAAERALRLSIEELRKSQNPLFQAELERLAQNQKLYEADLARLQGAPKITKISHETITRVIVDLSDTVRRQLRVRTHPLEVLVGPTIEPMHPTPRVVAFTAFGFVLGLVLGYFFALVATGLRAVRATPA